MKILHVNFWYNSGSVGKIVRDIHIASLQEGAESFVLYGRGPKVQGKNIIKVSSEWEAKVHALLARLFGVDFGYSFFSTGKAIRLIKKISPDVVHLHCLNGHFINAYRLIEYLKKSGIRTVLTLHAELMHTAGCEHAFECEKWKTECSHCQKMRGCISGLFRDDAAYCYRRMKKAMQKFDNLVVVSVSQWLLERAKQSPILEDKNHCVVYNGLDASIFKIRTGAGVKQELGIGEDEKIVFHVTPFFNEDPTHVKGGYYVLKLAEQMKDQKVRFVVAGEYAPEIHVPSNVILLGKVSNQEKLAELYSVADFTLLTSRRETFSMVTTESLCCGTPVIGFRAGGPEQIALKEFSTFVEHGNLSELENCILSQKQYEREKCSETARRVYSAETMVKEYREVYLQ